MSAFFITSSGTEIGKTFITGLMLRQLRAGGFSVNALKPVISDYSDDRFAESDTAHLLAAMARPADSHTIAAISPWRFAAPLSPDMAARREGRNLDLAEIVEFCRAAMAGPEEFLLIEGVGGVMVPLNDRDLVRDWMAALAIPAILVVGSYLGTISHTLTALDSLEKAGVPLAGIVISESADSGVPLDETLATIARFIGDTPLVCVPRLEHECDAMAAPDLTALLRKEGRSA